LNTGGAVAHAAVVLSELQKLSATDRGSGFSLVSFHPREQQIGDE